MKSISIIGGSDSDQNALHLAEEVGREAARRGIVLICGGMGGAMEAACKGAKEEGGLTVGILPTESKEAGNLYLDIAIPTGMGYARNFLVAKAGDAVIAIGGSAGTLSEMAIAWFSDKPVIALATTGGWATKLAGTRIDDRRSDTVISVDTAKEAIDKVMQVLEWE
ncbi:MAG: TIGR00725 family protein [Candidatus Thorarchaeota archaeon]|nr:TIGR00725 family protein [Candidatus Thorarchaeota archaeon]